MSFAFKEFKVFVVTFRIACEQGLVRIFLMQSLEYLSLCELILLQSLILNEILTHFFEVSRLFLLYYGFQYTGQGYHECYFSRYKSPKLLVFSSFSCSEWTLLSFEIGQKSSLRSSNFGFKLMLFEVLAPPLHDLFPFSSALIAFYSSLPLSLASHYHS